MEILTSKLHSIELNIINSKIQCLNREISLILRRFYNHQINKSQNTLRKINCNLNINLSLIRLSRHINNNSNTHLHYLHKNISMSLRLLKNKVYIGFTNNLIFKLNTLQRVVYYKKDIMYTKIRGTVVYREKKERLKRKIEVILKRLGERMMKDSEKYMNEKRLISFSPTDAVGSDKDHRDASYLDNDSTNEGYCTVNVYDSSSIDLEIGEAICTVNTITELHVFKEGSCEVENYANINNEVWSNKVCNVTKKNEEKINWKNQTVQVGGSYDQGSEDRNTRKHEVKAINHYVFTGNVANNNLSNIKDNPGDEIRFKEGVVGEVNPKNEINFSDKIVEENNSKEEINFKEGVVEENKFKETINFKEGVVEENNSKEEINFKDKIVEENKLKDNKKVENGCHRDPIQNFDSKICTVNTLVSGLVDKNNYNRMSSYHTIITSSLAKLNKKIVSKLYLSLQDLYIDIIKLKILLTLKQFQYQVNGQQSQYQVSNQQSQYQVNGQQYNSDKNSDNSKLTYILERGNLESDKRFLEMINDTLQDIEKYRDPIVIRMGIQFILAKRYVEDIIYLKE